MIAKGEKVRIYAIEMPPGEERNTVTSEEWEVEGIYPHVVLMRNARGIRECFTWHELAQRSRKPARVLIGGKAAYRFQDLRESLHPHGKGVARPRR